MKNIIDRPTFSKQAIDTLIALCEAAESVHHSGISRHDVIQKLADQDREMVNQCYDDLIRIRENNKTIINHE